ncbi:ATP-dependent DNA helicase [Trichonephila clavata]|uniref:ATP-dependent DNA helicase n=1 Tax=Trichonephila clavata TaxID=2740835 RepID=A0A8X6JKZ1_TRICU|nr:ATP-dependent DNA helicase [Trichonephila clavata]
MIELENNDYPDIGTFYEANKVNSDEEYLNILRAGITCPRVFLKREPSEKWHNAFNPVLFSLLQSNTDIHFITEEYSCAAYVVEYVNKANRVISNLQRQIIKIMDEHSKFDIVEITRKMSIDMLNTEEMTSQEAE